MMSAMEVQYLVALCCSSKNPEAVDIIVGDRVLDHIVGSQRDVDVTVTIKNNDGTSTAFKGFEVKREKKPLDITTVEQLCFKLSKMKDITHRAIVSASGFTSTALIQARQSNVELFDLKEWNQPLKKQFGSYPETGTPESFFTLFENNEFNFLDYTFYILNLPIPDSFFPPSTPLFHSNGQTHDGFPTLGDFFSYLLEDCKKELATSEALLREGEASFPQNYSMNYGEKMIGSNIPFSRLFQTTQFGAHLLHDRKLFCIPYVKLEGGLHFHKTKIKPEFKLMQSSETGKIYAGAAIMPIRHGEFKSFLLNDENREVVFNSVKLLPKHLNSITGLKIK